MPTIPDLRHNAEITKEHCFVLMDRLGQTLDLLEGTLNAFAGLAAEIDVEVMQMHFEANFEPEAFCRLFGTDIGKGVLVGTFIQVLSDQIMAQDLEEI
jgi:hypothetical protein